MEEGKLVHYGAQNVFGYVFGLMYGGGWAELINRRAGDAVTSRVEKSLRAVGTSAVATAAAEGTVYVFDYAVQKAIEVVNPAYDLPLYFFNDLFRDAAPGIALGSAHASWLLTKMKPREPKEPKEPFVRKILHMIPSYKPQPATGEAFTGRTDVLHDYVL
ncbi:MAG: hypothetical protein HYS81_02435 [Candidatus Aenigmatarchaeota archaeon]|nr:MAG: hypothetical protein HYS81_02435 [Candidatus Aenigmarchaeota archaeon]